MKELVHDGIGVWLAARRLNACGFVWPRDIIGTEFCDSKLSRMGAGTLFSTYLHETAMARLYVPIGELASLAITDIQRDLGIPWSDQDGNPVWLDAECH